MSMKREEIEKLKPCPFCGGRYVRAQQNGVRPNGSFAWWEVACDDCDIVVRPFDDREQAIGTWNRRAALDTLALRKAEARGMERAAVIAQPPLMHRKGRVGLWRSRRAAIAKQIRDAADCIMSGGAN